MLVFRVMKMPHLTVFSIDFASGFYLLSIRFSRCLHGVVFRLKCALKREKSTFYPFAD